MKQKIKLGIILGLEFLAIAVILALIFFSGKKSYKVTFELNGGTLISGELEQTVVQGKNATAPVVAKEGCYLHSWSASFKRVTHDMVVEAVWEWETSTGFEYTSTENRDYCEIVKSYEHLYGDVYVGVYHDEKKILGIQDQAFYNRDGITNIYMLDGMLYIGEYAFAECELLETVELPASLKKLGKNAFENCKSLKKVVFPEDMTEIPEYAFAGCTALEEIVIPANIKTIGENAFAGCTSLKKITFLTEDIVKEGDKKGDDPIVVGQRGIDTLDFSIFDRCDELVEIILPKTIKNVNACELTNPELTIYVPFEEDEIPEGFAENWNGEANVEWGYELPHNEDEDNSGRGK